MKKIPLIIIVDDDEEVRESLVTLLDLLEFKTVTYCTGEEFLENHNFDENVCVLLDYRLPGQSGVEILETLAGQNILVPVILISGQLKEGIRNRALKAGAFAVLDKPLLHDLLLETIEKASRAVSDKKSGV